MKINRVGVVHPGAMGVSLAAAIAESGVEVLWASSGRSQATRDRAERHRLTDAGSLAELVSSCELMLSICPPDAARSLASEVAEAGFDGVYVDANAIAPATAIEIGETITAAGGTFVDGGVIGGPAWKPGTTWLHLSGGSAQRIAPLFNAGPLEVNVLGDRPGRASALKMVFAAQTKGSSALLLATLAAAQVLDVLEPLQAQWRALSMPLADGLSSQVEAVARKAWRFAGEMEEVSATFTDAGVDGQLHAAAAEIYRGLADLQSSQELPALEQLLNRLIDN